ncbi:coth protein-domain-containing protein [Neocallimastix lanati (nom. inval.)]|uniref:CBM10 domain-containing protein n=1 Tax=Neocallimastix californiae TaxID=1754190 RepID=A0A1Y2A1S1_9FUNG|nr:coth protein-domain-containing protein [Neocallimastix sp. JGI-2020a]ORY16350.1 hypothetical protein LY90DRAFT_464651 [Neocallimastix californiae]|eukprot:ORY16350.1 hypothetical protein LY90DRAFT_464651 [Neocallimastix californiae]
MGPGFPFPGQEEDEFKVEDASLEFVLDGEKTTVDSITISVGGQFSKNSPKLGYNIKCNSGNLFGRKVFRLRSNVDDLTLMRAKLSCDVLNRLGLPSVSANYARLFFNGEFMGFYVLLDAYKTSWIKKVYEDEEVTDLYQCKQMNSDFSENNVRLCVNANNDYTNSTESLEEFITSINSAKSRKDVEDFMNVDVFVKVWIYEWLLGSWDHTLVNGKNYFLYKQVTGKWDLFIYDFDSMFGQNLRMFMRNSDNPATVPFDGWYKNRYIVDVLAKNDNSTFTKNLQEIVDKAFNPDVIFPHIDAIKSWITPYIKEDRTPVNGTLPGYINDKARGGFGGPGGPDSNNGHTFEEFDQNVEYTTLGSGIGIKKWIQDRYDYVCKNYKIKCHSTTKTNSTTTEVNPETSVNSTVDVSTATIDDTEETDVPTTIYPDTSEETTTEYEVTTTKANATTSVATTSPATPTITETPSKDEDENKDNEDSTCWSKSQGYSCCKTCNVYYVDKSGSWGVENGKWCGIKSDVCKIKVDRNCWSSGYGYSCCKTCKIYYTDDIGEWGIENGQWCGIVDSRCGINDDDNGVINGWNWNKKHNSATQGRNTNKWNNKNNHGNWGWGWGWRW